MSSEEPRSVGDWSEKKRVFYFSAAHFLLEFIRGTGVLVQKNLFFYFVPLLLGSDFIPLPEREWLNEKKSLFLFHSTPGGEWFHSWAIAQGDVLFLCYSPDYRDFFFEGCLCSYAYETPFFLLCLHYSFFKYGQLVLFWKYPEHVGLRFFSIKDLQIVPESYFRWI